jgi:nucleotide-binding universal stress UspA family protein
MLHRDGYIPAHRIEGADVAATIVNEAERRRASLIVMGTRGRTKSASILLGSVTQQVIQQAHCPVLALKSAGAPMNLAEAVLSRLRGATTVITAS